AALAPDDVDVVLYDGIGQLPHFNPDLEAALPATVVDLRARVAAAAGLLISSPEYAHGVPGSFKNALDWLVGGPEFVYKPVALFNASPRASYAQESLAETIRTMSGRIISEASLSLPLLGRGLDAEGIIERPELASAIRRAIIAFVEAIRVSSVTIAS
ncbi:MAG TPA: NADPH-dependent FMN reductase, partial [Gemmatimonadaceae bacterium]|nr:NADPH-dependent FMN reductase [Gemmatimonadaceae bacterium]